MYTEIEEEKDNSQLSHDDVKALFDQFRNETLLGGDDDIPIHFDEDDHHVEKLAGLLSGQNPKLKKKMTDVLEKIFATTKSNQVNTIEDANLFINNVLIPGMQNFFRKADSNNRVELYLYELCKDGETRNDYLSLKAREMVQLSDDVPKLINELRTLFLEATNAQLSEHLNVCLGLWKPTRSLCLDRNDSGTTTQCSVASAVSLILPRRLSGDIGDNKKTKELEKQRSPIKNRPKGKKYNTKKRSDSDEVRNSISDHILS
jgi:hypothetical protein